MSHDRGREMNEECSVMWQGMVSREDAESKQVTRGNSQEVALGAMKHLSLAWRKLQRAVLEVEECPPSHL